MKVFLIVLMVLTALTALYFISLMGRSEHKGLEELRKWSYAHRGLHGPGVPENSLAAFQRAKEQGFGVELDIHLMKDGNLGVIHDSSLERTAGADVKIEELTTEQLPQYPLEGTDQIVPTFAQVLHVLDGRVPVIVELKTQRNNYAQLCTLAYEALRNYPGPYCIESFDARCVRWFCRHHPDVIRGQLSMNFLRSGLKPARLPVLFAATYQLANFLTQPDFTAYQFGDRKNLSMTLVRKFWGVQGVAWTIQTKEDYDTALAEGWIPIFENFIP